MEGKAELIVSKQSATARRGPMDLCTFTRRTPASTRWPRGPEPDERRGMTRPRVVAPCARGRGPASAWAVSRKPWIRAGESRSAPGVGAGAVPGSGGRGGGGRCDVGQGALPEGRRPAGTLGFASCEGGGDAVSLRSELGPLTPSQSGAERRGRPRRRSPLSAVRTPSKACIRTRPRQGVVAVAGIPAVDTVKRADDRGRVLETPRPARGCGTPRRRRSSLERRLCPGAWPVVGPPAASPHRRRRDGRSSLGDVTRCGWWRASSCNSEGHVGRRTLVAAEALPVAKDWCDCGSHARRRPDCRAGRDLFRRRRGTRAATGVEEAARPARRRANWLSTPPSPSTDSRCMLEPPSRLAAPRRELKNRPSRRLRGARCLRSQDAVRDCSVQGRVATLARAFWPGTAHARGGRPRGSLPSRRQGPRRFGGAARSGPPGRPWPFWPRAGRSPDLHLRQRDRASRPAATAQEARQAALAMRPRGSSPWTPARFRAVRRPR